MELFGVSIETLKQIVLGVLFFGSLFYLLSGVGKEIVKKDKSDKTDDHD